MEPFPNTEQDLPAKEIKVTHGDKTEKETNPAYGMWLAKDHQLMCFLLTTLSREISTQVVNNTTSAMLWAAIHDMFTSQTRARTVNTRITLTNLQKGNMSIAKYFGKIRTLTDEMAAAGKKLDEEDMSRTSSPASTQTTTPSSPPCAPASNLSPSRSCTRS
jgi:hypothetical protein